MLLILLLLNIISFHEFSVKIVILRLINVCKLLTLVFTVSELLLVSNVLYESISQKYKKVSQKSQELRVHATRPLQIEYDQPDQVTLISSFPGGWSSSQVSNKFKQPIYLQNKKLNLSKCT